MVRWGIKSVITLGVNLALLTVWVEYAGIWPVAAAGINWLTVPILGYVITDRWVFRDAPSAAGLRGHFYRYLSMISVNNSAKIGNFVIFIVLIHVGIDYRAAWVIGAAAVFFFTFGGNRMVWTREIGA